MTDHPRRPGKRNGLLVVLFAAGVVAAGGLTWGWLDGWIGVRRFHLEQGEPTPEGMNIEKHRWGLQEVELRLRRSWESGEWQYHGTYYTWHDNGKLHREGRFEDGLLEGTWRTWRDDGSLDYEGAYRDGKPIGTWLYWHANGTKAREEVMATGAVRLWDHGGREILPRKVTDPHPEYRLGLRDLPWLAPYSTGDFADRVENRCNTKLDLVPGKPFTIILALGWEIGGRPEVLRIEESRLEFIHLTDGGKGYRRIRRPLTPAQRDALVTRFNELGLGRLSTDYFCDYDDGWSIGLTVIQGGRVHRTRFSNGWPGFLREWCLYLKNELLKLREEDLVGPAEEGLDELYLVDPEYCHAASGYVTAPYEPVE